MERFIEWFGYTRKCEEINSNVVIDYVSYIQRNTNSSATSINSYLKQLKVFFSYCTTNGYSSEINVKYLKTTQSIKQTYSVNEIEMLLKKPNMKKCNFETYRTWVAICMFCATGIRLSTLCDIRICDLNIESNQILLRKMKNRKQQTLELISEVVEILKEYLKIRGGETNDYLFCSANGKKMTTTGLYTSLKRYNLRRGISKTSVHLYRYFFAINYMKNGGNIYHLQLLLNHSNIKQTEHYLRGTPLNLANQNAINPFSVIVSKKINMKKMR